jgi:IstB-like ATP binding protein
MGRVMELVSADRLSAVAHLPSRRCTNPAHRADPTIADAICDRLVHNAHIVALRGPSMRRRKVWGPRAPEQHQPDHPLVAALRSGAQVDRALPDRMLAEHPGLYIGDRDSLAALLGG